MLNHEDTKLKYELNEAILAVSPIADHRYCFLLAIHIYGKDPD
jgi:hypothetical protein